MVGHGGRSELALAGVWALAVLAGCGERRGNGDASATIASCNAWCDALAARSCADPLYDTAADCKASECAGLGAEPARCLATTKAYYDCRAAQADICADTGCAAEGDADLNCLLGGGGGTGGAGGPRRRRRRDRRRRGRQLRVHARGLRRPPGRLAGRGPGHLGLAGRELGGSIGRGQQRDADDGARQPALTASGINGLPAVTFDGATTFLQIADSATTRWGTGDFALMVVARGAPNVATNAMLYNKSELAAPYAGINLFLNVTRGGRDRQGEHPARRGFLRDDTRRLRRRESSPVRRPAGHGRHAAPCWRCASTASARGCCRSPAAR